MAQRKTLLTVKYHYDTDTGMYKVGEIDSGISGELDTYLVKYGQKGADEIQLVLCYLIATVRERAGRLVEEPQDYVSGD